MTGPGSDGYELVFDAGQFGSTIPQLLALCRPSKKHSPNVRCWHIADIEFDAEHVELKIQPKTVEDAVPTYIGLRATLDSDQDIDPFAVPKLLEEA